MKTMIEAIKFWKMAYIKCGCQIVLGLASTLTAALNGAQWSNYNGTEQFLVFVACFGSIASVVLAFCSTTMSDLQQKLKYEKPDNGPTVG